MNLRRFKESDREGVNKLLSAENWDLLPEKLGGVGIVIEDGEEIVGFCWALTYEETEVAYIESLIVRRDKRGVGFHFARLIQGMMLMLTAMGKTKIVGAVPRGEEYTDMLAKYYQHIGGMKVSLGYFFVGNAGKILERIMKVGRRKAA